MKKCFFLLLSLSIFTSLFAQEKKFNVQNFNIKSGNVIQTDLKATIYLPDTTANAFYIYEYGSSKIEDGNDYNLFTKYVAKIKILNKEGYHKASIEIPLYKGGSGEEKIHDLKATTYYLQNGKKHSTLLSKKEIYREETEKVDYVKFTFPDIRPGAVLVYSYTLESPYIFNYHTWTFQEDIPKVYSEYHTEIPGNYNYNIKKVGELKLDTNEANIKKNCFYAGQTANGADCLVTTYAMKDIPAFIEEDYSTSKYNYISRIEFELMQVTHLDGYVKKFTKEWKDVDREIKTDKGIGRQLRKSRLVNDILPEEIKRLPNNLDKAKKIFEFVRNNYKWNGRYRIFDKMNLRDLLKEHTGNISSINVLLHNLYDSEGYKVNPILSATRSLGFPTKIHPVLSDFNYLMVLLTIDDQEYFLDATGNYTKFGQLPYRALNQYGRKIDFDKGSEWVSITANQNSFEIYNDSLKVNQNGTASLTSHVKLTGYEASSARKVINTYKNAPEEELFLKLNNLRNSYQLNSTNFENEKATEKPLKISYKVKNNSQKINDVIYLNPFTFLFWTENPFKLEERKHPIDFGFKRTYINNIVIKIPENYSISEMPENILLGLPNKTGVLKFIIQKIADNTITIQYLARIDSPMYPSEYYPYLKEFIDRAIDIQKQTVVVLTKNKK
ncbi:DUF3857 domain-containing protein [Zunongwangia sp.]|uniref:DUF3857 domain-containing protein n=1 Tax=Zunongwangia sp. TaxID=1965325 RepID=UPI003AA936B1